MNDIMFLVIEKYSIEDYYECSKVIGLFSTKEKAENHIGTLMTEAIKRNWETFLHYKFYREFELLYKAETDEIGYRIDDHEATKVKGSASWPKGFSEEKAAFEAERAIWQTKRNELSREFNEFRRINISEPVLEKTKIKMEEPIPDDLLEQVKSWQGLPEYEIHETGVDILS